LEGKITSIDHSAVNYPLKFMTLFCALPPVFKGKSASRFKPSCKYRSVKGFIHSWQKTYLPRYISFNPS